MDELAYPLAVIPARAMSSRFPQKPLAEILGKPMIQYVWEAGSAAQELKKVVVATDSEEIQSAVLGFGGDVVLTGQDFFSGSDRVAWVAEKMGAKDHDIVVNLQGDEPLVRPEAIDALVCALKEEPETQMATLAVTKNEESELQNPNVVKVLASRSRNAIYFSRHPLRSGQNGFLKHIGIYAFRFGALKQFCRLPESRLEKVEKLEQLRAIENGFQIKIIEASEDTIAVDIPEDVSLVEEALRIREGNPLGENHL